MPELTYAQLDKATAALAKDVARSSEEIRGYATNMIEEARDTGQVADGIGSLGVDSATVGETRDLAKIMAGLEAAATSYAAASNTTARSAQAARDQNKDSHHGIGEAVSRSSVGSHIYDVNRAWFAQE
ncbi:hypothetical protein [Streptomyces olivochromogenes]|uniref:ESX-1 secretion-associated protein n=1 Tax=Streptomyces olivochromogenes TaxID=1963 RepID=A0A250VT26_STROL|nr:hypothetical protein [Streptomyces olivochromogenes]KUN38258.1 hypothetical protein AQJ27_44970 [Streptomyces olivochromogenes]GAX57301.1 hypothetical protein SO3561_08871 [Streptomyces olivochromogenes]